MSEINNTDSNTTAYGTYGTEGVKNEEIKKEETTAPVEKTPAQPAEVAEKVAEVAEKSVAVATQKILPLNLKGIKRKDVKKADKELFNAHVPKHAKNLQWDKARSILVIEKSGKYRAYKIGAGKAPALVERKKLFDVKAFLKTHA